MPREERLEEGIPGYQKSLYGLGTAFAAYGVTELPPHGNGLIAVYIAAITLGIKRADIRTYFQQQAEDLVEIVKVGVFVVFGSLLTLHGLFADGWAAVAIAAVALLVARPVGVFSALAGTATDRATRAFMSWFGPKGVSTMTFSLLILTSRITAGVRIFNLAALTVFTQWQLALPIDKIELQPKGDHPTVSVFSGKPTGGEDRKFVVDARSGALLSVEAYADKPFLTRLHSGEAFGDGGLVVAMFWGLALIVLTISGLIIYCLMHRRNLKGIQRVFW